MANVKRFNGICLSDIHTLHKKTPTSHIVDNLNRFFYIDNNISDFNFHFWNGDLFHTSVEAKSEDLFIFKKWFKKYLTDCGNNDIIVRILEGTSLHDSGQAKGLLLLPDNKVDIRYVTSLEIEVFKEFDDYSVMYVPDNFGSIVKDNQTTEQYIYELALAELSNYNLSKVDMIMFHGGFDYQVRGMGGYRGHESSQWEAITNYAIFSGHIHRPSHKGKIWGTGSFDRIGHGEEHAKGACTWTLDKQEKEIKVTFYVNKNSFPYLTIDVNKEQDSVEIIELIKLKINKINNKGRIKIRGGEGNVIKPIINILKKEYPLIGFDEENSISSSNVTIDNEVFIDKKYEGVTLTKDNLTSNLMAYMSSFIKESGHGQDEYEKVLKEYL